ncbi:MAG TPA: dihydrolipoamide acetyltransferase family protein [Polyangiaceae bacterium]|nr:dihydrolipoamide acetyltransferase family protein [Polyangiaceae bacterium]
MSINLVMPSLGESVIEGTITKWLVHEGDVVTREQPVVSVATDKADSDVPAPQGGRILKILAPEGATVKVGDPLCEIDASGASLAPNRPANATVPAPPPEGMSATSEPPSAAKPAPADRTSRPAAAVRDEAASAASGDNGTGRSSPVVRKLALEHGVNLDQVEGSGARGRVTREDVMRAAETRTTESPARGPTEATVHGVADPDLAALLGTGVKFPAPNVGYGAYKVPPYRAKDGDQVVPFTRRRRLTADHMVYSKLTAPHVVTVAEIDLYRTSKLREQNKDRYKKEGVPLTMLSFVCTAIVRALREFAAINARVLDDSYVLLKDVNLGIAVDAPDGLIVPNIKRADELSLRGLAKAIDDVAGRARAGKITADDLAGCSFSVSNPGIKGNLFGGAIIAQPNAAILRMGEIKKRVVVVEVDGQDTMVVHPVMYVALSYDHRIIDGVLGNSFLYRVREILEKAEFEV